MQWSLLSLTGIYCLPYCCFCSLWHGFWSPTLNNGSPKLTIEKPIFNNGKPTLNNGSPFKTMEAQDNNRFKNYFCFLQCYFKDVVICTWRQYLRGTRFQHLQKITKSIVFVGFLLLNMGFHCYIWASYCTPWASLLLQMGFPIVLVGLLRMTSPFADCEVMYFGPNDFLRCVTDLKRVPIVLWSEAYCL